MSTRRTKFCSRFTLLLILSISLSGALFVTDVLAKQADVMEHSSHSCPSHDDDDCACQDDCAQLCDVDGSCFSLKNLLSSYSESIFSPRIIFFFAKTYINLPVSPYSRLLRPPRINV